MLPANGVFYLLPRLIGLGHTTRLMLTAEKVQAEDAMTYGIVSSVYEQDDLLREARRVAREMLENSETATAMAVEVAVVAAAAVAVAATMMTMTIDMPVGARV